jgi:eukaryotic-like serine/threonine-protein kinase
MEQPGAFVPAAGGVPPTIEGLELSEPIARGGTSEVWAGVRTGDRRPVAVKLLHAAPDAVEMAARESALSARAAGAHVVPVEAVLPLDDGRVAVVMPLLRGGSLDALVRARGHLLPGEVVTVLAPVAGALGRLHALGVVHGDVSPGNILLDLDGRPLLADLGLGHVLGESPVGVWGTDGYLAPEVLVGASPDPASDVYSVGALGWRCLTGAIPGAPGLRPALRDVVRIGEDAAAVVAVLDAALDPDPAARPDADDLAWRLFRAAEPAPLDLVRPDDEVSSVTYRLRAVADTSLPHADPDPPRRAGRHARPRPQRGPRTTVGGRDTPPRRPRRVPGVRVDSRPAVRRRTVEDIIGTARSTLTRLAIVRPRGRSALAMAVIGVVLFLAAGTGLGDVDEDPAGEARAARAAPVVLPPTAPAVPPRASRDARADPSAPRSRTVELLGVLARARARAWREARPDLLRESLAPGSPMAISDEAAVSGFAADGLRCRGLSYRVREAVVVSASSEMATLRSAIGTTAYTVVGPSGASARPADPGQVVLVDLVRLPAGWRVQNIRAAPAPR